MYDLQSSFGQFKEALSSGRPKVTIGLVSIAVVLTVLCGVSGGLLSVFGFQATNILHGYAGVPFFWTLLTFNFFESDWWMLFLSLPVLLLCPLLEEHYGFVSVAKLILAVGSINGVVLFFWRILHWSIFQAEAPFFSPVGSCACVAVSVLIGVRQVSGQSCVRLMGGLEIPVQPRFLPLLLLCVVCVLCVVGVTGDFSLVSAIVGMVGGWTYFRYFVFCEMLGTVGDHSKSFEFPQLFPEAVRPVLVPLVAVGDCCLRSVGVKTVGSEGEAVSPEHNKAPVLTFNADPTPLSGSSDNASPPLLTNPHGPPTAALGRPRGLGAPASSQEMRAPASAGALGPLSHLSGAPSRVQDGESGVAPVPLLPSSDLSAGRFGRGRGALQEGDVDLEAPPLPSSPPLPPPSSSAPTQAPFPSMNTHTAEAPAAPPASSLPNAPTDAEGRRRYEHRRQKALELLNKHMTAKGLPVGPPGMGPGGPSASASGASPASAGVLKNPYGTADAARNPLMQI